MIPKVPLPAKLRPSITFTDAGGEVWEGLMDSINIEFQDLFQQLPLSGEIPWPLAFEVRPPALSSWRVWKWERPVVAVVH